LLFREFYDSTRSPGGGFFGRLRLPQNDGVNGKRKEECGKRNAENRKQKTEFKKFTFS